MIRLLIELGYAAQTDNVFVKKWKFDIESRGSNNGVIFSNTAVGKMSATAFETFDSRPDAHFPMPNGL